MSRRRYLLSVLSTEMYRKLLFNYLYHDLFPATIQDRTVRNQGKTKIAKIEGNGEIENQLVENGDFSDGKTGWYVYSGSDYGTLSVSNGVATVTANATASSSLYRFGITRSIPRTTKDHKYLICFMARSNNVSSLGFDDFGNYNDFSISNNWRLCSIIYSETNDNGHLEMMIRPLGRTINIGDTYEIANVYITDLTTRFGTGNEPTSTNDARIKRIIEKGYVPKTDGTYNSSVVSEVTCSRLPKEYQEVEYIENSGTQYIDTGWKTNFNIGYKITAKIMPLSTPSDSSRCALLSNYSDANDFSLELRGTSYALIFYIGNKTARTDNNSIIANQINNVELTFYNNAGYIKANNTQANYNIVKSGNGNGNCFIFVDRSLRWGTFTCYYRLYSFKITDGTTLVRNFIPCYRKADNVAGLYDLVNGVFYTNAGTGEFLKGSDVVDKKIRLPQPLKLDGAINAHNTFEITKDEYVFTRNVWNVNMRVSMNWSSGSFGTAPGWYSDTVTNLVTPSYGAKPNAVAEKYSTVVSRGDALKIGTITFAYGNFKRIWVGRNDGDTDIANSPSGFLYYQLDTPQVIRIPRKHLGCVRLKDLDWIASSTANRFYCNVNNIGYKHIANVPMFSAKYYYDGSTGGSPYYGDNMHIKSYYVASQSTHELYIRNDSCSTLADLLNSLTDDDVLFFETENEVTDFVNEATFQKGGEINGEQLNIPVEYQEVEYIESTGTQYIDTQTDINSNDKVYFEMSQYSYGFENVNKHHGFAGIAQVCLDYNYVGSSINDKVVINGVANIKSLAINKDITFEVNGNILHRTSGLITEHNSFLVFAIYVNNIIDCNISRVYSLKLWQNDIFIRDMVPCYRKSDGVIGLYDKVNGKFYTNQGAGTFLKGKNVNNDYTCETLPNVEMKVQVK